MKNLLNKCKTFFLQHKSATAVLAICVCTAIVTVSLMIVFVPGAKLMGLEIETPPTKTQYIEKETLCTDGMVVKAYFGDKSEVVTDYSVDKTVLQVEDKLVTVSYTVKKATQTATFAIDVRARRVAEIVIVTPPEKTEYIEGEMFDPMGITVQAAYDNGERELVSDWDYDIKQSLEVENTKITVRYGGQSATVAIIVQPKRLQSITATRLPERTAYIEGEYFDFYGLEIEAAYANAPTERIYGWTYDKTEPLTVSDTTVTVSYTAHGVTKTLTVAITVTEKIELTSEEQLLANAIAVLPPTETLTKDNLASIEYVLTLLSAVSLTPEQAAFMTALQAKRQEILDALPPTPETEYTITYGIAHELYWDDVDYGGNPTKHKNSDGEVMLAAAVSAQATEEGYAFVGWLSDGKPIAKIDALSGDITVYALFERTPTVDIVFKSYQGDEDLLTLRNILRTENYDFKTNNIAARIYDGQGVLPIAYYNGVRTRVDAADLSCGKEVTVYVVTAQARELHLANGDSVTVGWSYIFTVDAASEQAEATPTVGTTFTVPIGATVSIVSTHANIGDILVDGVRMGEKVNNTVVQAVFTLAAGEYPASVTFETILTDMTTVSFVGYNAHAIVYPAGWNGYIAANDLETVAFIYDEASVHYLTTYTINGAPYYFDDLAAYRFDGDTQVWVSRVRNSFSFAVQYRNGTEKFDDLIGKQSLQAALAEIEADTLATLQTILDDGRLYADSNRQTSLTKAEILATVLRGDITVYSDWERPAPPDEKPSFDPVDYGDCDCIGVWTATFLHEADILSSELELVADGAYRYRTWINGDISVDISGVYRIENDMPTVKTVETNDPNALVTANDMKIEALFVRDGLLCARFIDLRGTVKTIFDHTLTRGPVRPVNYNGKAFIGAYEADGVLLELRENGTVVIRQNEIQTVGYYRVTDDMRLFIYDNEAVGTGEIVGLLGGTL